MSLLKVLHYGHPLLRERAEEVAGVDQHTLDTIHDMAVTMYENEGVGLAGPQVGVMRRIFVADVGRLPDEEDTNPDLLDNELDEDDDEDYERNEDDEDDDGPDTLLVFINPEIVDESPDDGPYEEGCLSIPGVRGEVFRPLRVRVRARDEHFEPFEVEATGLLARVIQHELDHLNGVLFIDHLPLMKRGLLAGDLNRIKRAATEELPSLEGADYPIVVAADPA